MARSSLRCWASWLAAWAVISCHEPTATTTAPSPTTPSRGRDPRRYAPLGLRRGVRLQRGRGQPTHRRLRRRSAALRELLLRGSVDQALGGDPLHLAPAPGPRRPQPSGRPSSSRRKEARGRTQCRAGRRRGQERPREHGRPPGVGTHAGGADAGSRLPNGGLRRQPVDSVASLASPRASSISTATCRRHRATKHRGPTWFGRPSTGSRANETPLVHSSSTST